MTPQRRNCEVCRSHMSPGTPRRTLSDGRKVCENCEKDPTGASSMVSASLTDSAIEVFAALAQADPDFLTGFGDADSEPANPEMAERIMAADASIVRVTRRLADLARVADDSQFADYKADRPLTGASATPITSIIPGAKKVAFEEVPFWHDLNRLQGTHSAMDPQTYASTRAAWWDKNVPAVQVPLKGTPFVVTQDNVNMPRVSQIIDRPETGGSKPLYMVSHGGALYTINGHHRLAADYLAGKPHIEARVLDLDKVRAAASLHTTALSHNDAIQCAACGKNITPGRGGVHSGEWVHYDGDASHPATPRSGWNASLHRTAQEFEFPGHEGHQVTLVSTSWGQKAQCDDCKRVVKAWGEDGPLDWIPNGVTYTPTHTGARQVVAHDSGDGQTIYHCPFCGSGQVIGGHDGTVSCDFCGNHFTVQVQPEFAAMPQTVDGVPYPMPGMPGSTTDTQPGSDAEQDVDDANADADSQQMPPDPGMADPTKPDPNDPNNIGTAQGSLPFKSGLAHYALRHARDREQVLATVRAMNQET